MKALFLTLIISLTCAILTASAQSPQPAILTPTKGVTALPVAVEGLEVRVEGTFVLVTLAYHNATATPLSIGLQQWANAMTGLVDDVHNSYTLLQTFGIGYGYDRRYWLALEAHGYATATFLFRAEDPSSKQATRYTLTSGQQVIADDPTTGGLFTIALRNLKASSVFSTSP
jgi:hypothetical protein